MNIKARGTPPVFAKTPLITAIVRRNFDGPRLSMKYAATAPGKAAIPAENIPIFIELRNPVLYGSLNAVSKLLSVKELSLDKKAT
jgi:hypothetical protein